MTTRRRAASAPPWLAAVLTLGCTLEPAAPKPEGEVRAEAAVEPSVRLERPADRVLMEAPARVVSTAPARGEIKVLHRALVVRRHVAAGDRVTAGQTLIEAAMPEVSEAIGLYRAALARLELAERRHAQIAPLQKEGLLKASELYELEQSIHELRATRARTRAVWQAAGLEEKELASIERAGLIPLRAPVDGVVVRLHAELGHMAEPGGAALAEVQGEAAGRIEANLSALPPEGVMLSFQAIDGRTLALSAKPAESILDPSSGRFTVWYRPADPAPLPPGLLGKLRVQPGTAALFELPSQAVGRDEAGTFVLAERAGGPERVPVVVLSDRRGRVVFSAALEAGSAVHLDRGAAPAGHAH